ncbi:sigma factor-like helix-turn-helix DNA-binding protein [Streptomyces sp. NPDC093111]|uniref:sigma factor-like helix-turn-helix DNA-binding protein n=1 Tax=Streptomyces sp. NPDC093111 TaxID=3154978 RepID=UPI00343AEE69
MDTHAVGTGTRPRAVAYRLLGSDAEADAALREAERGAGPGAPAPAPGGAPTPSLAALVRVCLARLREREASWSGPEPGPLGAGPGEEAVLDALPPAERVAYVLHDDFGVPIDTIAPAMGLTPAATRQLAARARRRVAETDEMPEPDPTD